MANLYFYGTNGNWDTLSNWKTTDSPTGTTASALPTSSDDVFIRRTIISNSGSDPTVNSFTSTGIGHAVFNNSTQITITSNNFYFGSGSLNAFSAGSLTTLNGNIDLDGTNMSSANRKLTINGNVTGGNAKLAGSIDINGNATISGVYISSSLGKIPKIVGDITIAESMYSVGENPLGIFSADIIGNVTLNNADCMGAIISGNLIINGNSVTYNRYFNNLYTHPLVSGNVVVNYPAFAFVGQSNGTIAYSGYASPRTLYYNNDYSTEWNDVGNWWTDASYETAASGIPTPLDTVYIDGDISGSSVIGQAYSINLTNTSDNSDTILSTNNINLFDFSSNVGYLLADNNIVLSDSSYNNGFYIYADAISYTDNSLNLNVASGGPSNITYNGFTGWDADLGYYFIGGELTSLDSEGYGDHNELHYSSYPTTFEGWDSGNSTYYFSGVATTLNSDGNGYWVDTYYLGGVATTLNSDGNGYWVDTYYLGGVATPLNSDGNGCLDNKIYTAGSVTFDPATDTGYNTCDSTYYVSGVATTLDSSGYGNYDGVHYSAYPTTFEGWDAATSTYYFSGVATTLDSSGNGNWNGIEYINGLSARTLYFNGGVDSDWNNLSNWWTSNTYSTQAVALPSSIDSTVMSATCNTNSGSEPTVVNLTYSSGNLGIAITVTGTATFKDTSYNDNLITGDAIFLGNSYLTATAQVTGSATFRDNSYNLANCGSVIAQHGGGINGSNILGIV